MSLHVSLIRDPETGRDTAIVTDDRGLRLRCVRAVTVQTRTNEASRVTIEFIVNGRDFTLGEFVPDTQVPPFQELQEPKT